MVYQLALNTTFGVQSHVYYELNMAEVKVKHAGDHAFGYEKPDPVTVHRFLNTQRILQRETKMDEELKEKFQISIHLALSNKLHVYEFETASQFSLWFEAGGLLFLIHLAVGILL